MRSLVLLSAAVSGLASGCGLTFALGAADAGSPDVGPLDAQLALDAGVDASALDAASADAGLDAALPCDAGVVARDETTCDGRPCPEPRRCLPRSAEVDAGAYCDLAVDWGFRTMSAGDTHACYVSDRGAGVVACWGASDAGQLGGELLDRAQAAPDDRPLVVVVPRLGGPVQHVAAGHDFTCVSLVEGITCWGGVSREWGAACGERAHLALPGGRLVAYGFGFDRGDDSARPPHPALEAGHDFACALATDGSVWCWGGADHGQLGNDPSTDPAMRPLPVRVPLASGFAAIGITAGARHACAWAADGSAACWGDNARAQLGDGTSTARATPVEVSVAGATIRAMSAGHEHTCAIVESAGVRRVRCWGRNVERQAGGTARPFLAEGIDVEGTEGAASLSAGARHTCAVRDPAAPLRCWGDNEHGQCGLAPGAPPYVGSEVAADAVEPGVLVHAGGEFTCLVIPGGVHCVGWNVEHQLGVEGDWWRPGHGPI